MDRQTDGQTDRRKVQVLSCASQLKIISLAPLTMILRVGIPNLNFYPYMKNERTGEWSGVFIDFLEELKKEANFSYTYVTNDLNSFDDAGDIG